MKKTIYYIRIILFIAYLIIMFLLIKPLFGKQLASNIYFFCNILYSFIILLTILSKKRIYKDMISYNILNIGIYIYTFILYFITNYNTKLDIINHKDYFQNNFILLSILVIGLGLYTLYINTEKEI